MGAKMNLLNVRFGNEPLRKESQTASCTCQSPALVPVCSTTSPLDGGQTMYEKVNFIYKYSFILISLVFNNNMPIYQSIYNNYFFQLFGFRQTSRADTDCLSKFSMCMWGGNIKLSVGVYVSMNGCCLYVALP